MLTFIAGATTTGALVARYSVLSASSAMPRANLPTLLAVAGATSSRSASSARLMCRISPFSPSAHWSWNTGWRESASNVSGVTNCVAARRHHHPHVHAAPLQLAQHLARLVGADAARDAENDDAIAAPSTPRARARTRRTGLELVEDLPGHGVRERLLHRDPGRLAAARLHARLGAALQLLGALRGHRDEAELGIDFPRKDQLAHAVSLSFAPSKLLSIARALAATTATRQRAARTMPFRSSTHASRSSLTIA